MGSVLEAIEDWIRGLLVSGIMGNLTSIFDSVNNQVGQIATEVGRTPASFSPAVYGMIRTLSENVIMPIAGLILTFIACYELIQLVISHNNLANFETWIFKTFVAVTLITNTMNITMAVFDVAQHVVSQAGGIIGGSTAVDASALATMQATLIKRRYENHEGVSCLNVWDYQDRAYREAGYLESIPFGASFRCLMKANSELLQDVIEKLKDGDVVIEQTFFKAKRSML